MLNWLMPRVVLLIGWEIIMIVAAYYYYCCLVSSSDTAKERGCQYTLWTAVKPRKRRTTLGYRVLMRRSTQAGRQWHYNDL